MPRAQADDPERAQQAPTIIPTLPVSDPLRPASGVFNGLLIHAGRARHDGIPFPQLFPAATVSGSGSSLFFLSFLLMSLRWVSAEISTVKILLSIVRKVSRKMARVTQLDSDLTAHTTHRGMPSDLVHAPDSAVNPRLVAPVTEIELKALYLLLINRLPSSRDIASHVGQPLLDEFTRVARSGEFSKLRTRAEQGEVLLIPERGLLGISPLLDTLFGSHRARSILAERRWDRIVGAVLKGELPGGGCLLGAFSHREDMAQWRTAHQDFVMSGTHPCRLLEGRCDELLPEAIVETTLGRASAAPAIPAAEVVGTEGLLAELVSGPAFYAAVVIPSLTGERLRHEAEDIAFSGPHRKVLAVLAGFDYGDFEVVDNWRSAFAILMASEPFRILAASRLPDADARQRRADFKLAAEVLAGGRRPTMITSLTFNEDMLLVGRFILGSDVSVDDLRVEVSAPARPDLTFSIALADVSVGGDLPSFVLTLSDDFSALARLHAPEDAVEARLIGKNDASPAVSCRYAPPSDAIAAQLERGKWLYNNGRVVDALDYLAPLIDQTAFAGDTGFLRYDISMRVQTFKRELDYLKDYAARFRYSGEGWQIVGAASVRLGDLAVAADAFDRARALHATFAPSQKAVEALSKTFAQSSDTSVGEAAAAAGLDVFHSSLMSLAVDAFVQNDPRPIATYCTRLDKTERRRFSLEAGGMLVDGYFDPDRTADLLAHAISGELATLADHLTFHRTRNSIGAFLFVLRYVRAVLIEDEDILRSVLQLHHQLLRQADGLDVAERLLAKSNSPKGADLQLIAETRRAAGDLKGASEIWSKIAFAPSAPVSALAGC